MSSFLRLIIVWASCLTTICVAQGTLAKYADPTPLQTAIEDYGSAEKRWAYTETLTEFSRQGDIRKVRVTRVDPSLPWDERDVLVTVDGEPATARQKRKYQQQREKERRRAERGIEHRRRLRDQLNFPLCRIENKTPRARIYEVPLLPDTESGFPTDKIQMFIEIDPRDDSLRSIDAKLRESVRHKLVANIKDLSLTIEFSRPLDTPTATAITTLRGHAAASVVFFPVGGEILLERTDHRWVTPYDDRFQVELGSPTTVEF